MRLGRGASPARWLDGLTRDELTRLAHLAVSLGADREVLDELRDALERVAPRTSRGAYAR